MFLTSFVSVAVRDEGTITTVAPDTAMTTEQLGQLIRQLNGKITALERENGQLQVMLKQRSRAEYYLEKFINEEDKALFTASRLEGGLKPP
jgi:hypothetical protein